jgi:two-component system, sporulation sensor kinase E
MPMKSGFVEKLIERLDRLDPESLQSHFLRLAQDRGLLEMVFQSIQEGILVVSSEGDLDYANRAAEQFLGFTLDSERGRPVSRYLGEVDWDRILSLDTQEWSKLVSREIEITYPVQRFLTFYVVPMHQDAADSRGALVILRDVTHEREQEASARESERINAVKLLAAGVAHEIGNPLNALNIHLQLLDREIGNLREDAAEGAATSADDLNGLHELTEVARTEVARLDQIITQFLQAIRPTRPELMPNRIEMLLEETLALLKQEVQDRNISIEIDRPDSLPQIKVDGDQIKQVFFNVIRNAFQAMPDGGQLKILLFTNDEYLGISFRDSGIGIRREEFSRIFEPYHSTKSSGSGLGLMIVQRIVQEHGGQIEVMSKPDTGTGFTVLLPLAERSIRLLNAQSTRRKSKGHGP